MCLMCEGKTEAEMIAAWAESIDREGWMALSVEGKAPGWTYSLGLQWSFDHPELIVTHPDGAKAADLLRHAVDEIQEGRRFVPGSRIETPCGATARFEAVHHGNLGGEWFGRWPHVAAACGVGTMSLRAVQAIVDCCSCVGCLSQPLLDRRCTPSWHTTVRRRRRRHGQGGHVR